MKKNVQNPRIRRKQLNYFELIYSIGTIPCRPLAPPRDDYCLNIRRTLVCVPLPSLHIANIRLVVGSQRSVRENVALRIDGPGDLCERGDVVDVECLHARNRQRGRTEKRTNFDPPEM